MLMKAGRSRLIANARSQMTSRSPAFTSPLDQSMLPTTWADQQFSSPAVTGGIEEQVRLCFRRSHCALVLWVCQGLLQRPFDALLA